MSLQGKKDKIRDLYTNHKFFHTKPLSYRFPRSITFAVRPRITAKSPARSTARNEGAAGMVDNCVHLLPLKWARKP